MMKTIFIQLNGIIRDYESKVKEVFCSEKDCEEIDFEQDKELKEILGFETLEDYIEFLYVESPMRVFGYSKEREEGIIHQLNEFYRENRDKIKICIFSNEIEKSKPATFMFLARYGCLIDNIHFFPLMEKQEIINQCDLLIVDESFVEEEMDEKVVVFDYNDESSYKNKIINFNEILNYDNTRPQHSEGVSN